MLQLHPRVTRAVFVLLDSPAKIYSLNKGFSN